MLKELSTETTMKQLIVFTIQYHPFVGIVQQTALLLVRSPRCPSANKLVRLSYVVDCLIITDCHSINIQTYLRKSISQSQFSAVYYQTENKCISSIISSNVIQTIVIEFWKYIFSLKQYIHTNTYTLIHLPNTLHCNRLDLK